VKKSWKSDITMKEAEAKKKRRGTSIKANKKAFTFSLLFCFLFSAVFPSSH